MTDRKHRFDAQFRWVEASAAALITGLAAASAATAEEAARGPVQIEEVVVTGTHIKGQAPIGCQVVTIDREEIRTIGRANMAGRTPSLPR